jgi:hypothetical protein
MDKQAGVLIRRYVFSQTTGAMQSLWKGKWRLAALANGHLTPSLAQQNLFRVHSIYEEITLKKTPF